MKEYAKTDYRSMYDLIIGMESLHGLKAVLDFKNSRIEINNVILPMLSLSAIQDLSMF